MGEMGIQVIIPEGKYCWVRGKQDRCIFITYLDDEPCCPFTGELVRHKDKILKNQYCLDKVKMEVVYKEDLVRKFKKSLKGKSYEGR